MGPIIVAICVFVGAFVLLSAPHLLRNLTVNRLMDAAWNVRPSERTRELLRALDQGDIEPLRSALSRAARSRDWDLRGYYVYAAGLGEHVELYARWVKREPGSSEAHLMRAEALARRGYDVRGSDTFDTVSARDAGTFATLTERARISYLEAARLDPDDPAPWAGLLLTGTSLGMPLSEAWELYAEAAERHPGNWVAAEAMLRATCRKWGGSHEVMFEFAREAAEGAPLGDPRNALIALAHFERWMYFAWFDDDRGAGARHCADPGVQAEVEAALMEAFGPAPLSAIGVARARLSAATWYGCSGAAGRGRELSRQGLEALHAIA